MLAETIEWVATWLQESQRAGPSGIVDIADVDVHPAGETVACRIIVRTDPGSEPQSRIAVVEASTGELRPIDLAFDQCSAPKWSGDGELLAAVVSSSTERVRAVVIDPCTSEIRHEMPSVDGVVEDCRWSPDGTRLALLIADDDAEVSDVYGSGFVGGARGTWRPQVSPAAAGKRSVAIWDVSSGRCRPLEADNVWEMDWADDGSLLALTSPAAGEGAWYEARLTLISLDASPVVLHIPRHQLAQPRSAPRTKRWSVLAGPASDRGLLAGAILVGEHDAANADAPVDVGPSDVHVTDHMWLADDRIAFAGMRGLETVIGVVDPDSGQVEIAWKGTETTGQYAPQLACSAESIWGVLESHKRPPTLGRFDTGGFRPLVSTAGAGSDSICARTGSTDSLTWTSDDGTEIQGLISVPDGDRPHALVVLAHGGPIFAWRDGWIGRDPYASLLLASGYAVLRPNPRGSSGRGDSFAEAVIGDMGGQDVEDVLSGVRALVDQGSVDPSRVGITGNSYGGYLSAWIPCVSNAFAAAVARSPVTDWITQHYTSNLAEFDRMMLCGDVSDPGSQYVSRSPFRFHERIATPILLTAGLRDLATPASQAQLLHHALKERGVETALAVYPEEGHGVREPAALVDQCARMVAWFERFMPATHREPSERAEIRTPEREDGNHVSTP